MFDNYKKEKISISLMLPVRIKAVKDNPDDERIVYEMCTKSPDCFKYASDRLKDKKSLVISIIEEINDGNKCRTILKDVSEGLKNDKEFIIKVLEYVPEFYLCASEEIRADRDVALIASSSTCIIPLLNYCSEELKDDLQVVYAFCSQNGSNYYNASSRLQGDRKILLRAIKSGLDILFIDSAYFDDYEIIYEAVKVNGASLSNASERLREDRKIVLTALNGHFPHNIYWRRDDIDGIYEDDLFKYIGPVLKADERFMIDIINAFLDTPPGANYSFEDFKDNLSKIYDVLITERNKLEINEEEELEYGFDLTPALICYSL